MTRRYVGRGEEGGRYVERGEKGREMCRERRGRKIPRLTGRWVGDKLGEGKSAWRYVGSPEKGREIRRARESMAERYDEPWKVGRELRRA